MTIGKKFDGGKIRFSLLPWKAVREVVEVLEFGAKLYDVGNWKKVKKARTRYFNALLRHATLWWEGERNDPDSGRHHLAHAVCCGLFLLWFDLSRKLSGNSKKSSAEFHTHKHAKGMGQEKPMLSEWVDLFNNSFGRKLDGEVKALVRKTNFGWQWIVGKNKGTHESCARAMMDADRCLRENFSFLEDELALSVGQEQGGIK